MQTITTKYFGPGNRKGSRIKATSTSGLSLYRPFDHALDVDANHREAAHDLSFKLGWGEQTRLVGGTLNAHGDKVWVIDEEAK